MHRLASATVLGADLALADECSTAASAHGSDTLRWLEDASRVESLLVTHDGRQLRTSVWPTLSTSSAG